MGLKTGNFGVEMETGMGAQGSLGLLEGTMMVWLGSTIDDAASGSVEW